MECVPASAGSAMGDQLLVVVSTAQLTLRAWLFFLSFPFAFPALSFAPFCPCPATRGLAVPTSSDTADGLSFPFARNTFGLTDNAKLGARSPRRRDKDAKASSPGSKSLFGSLVPVPGEPVVLHPVSEVWREVCESCVAWEAMDEVERCVRRRCEWVGTSFGLLRRARPSCGRENDMCGRS